MHNKTKIILGPPGTGKTTTLLNLVEQELAKGTPPDRIGFLLLQRKPQLRQRREPLKNLNYKINNYLILGHYIHWLLMNWV